MSNRIRLVKAFLWFVPLLYLGFVLLTVARIYAEPLSTQTHHPVVVVDEDKSAALKAAGSRDVEKEEIDNLKAGIEKRSDDLQKLTSQLTLGNAVYTALLGLLAYFGLRESTRSADRLIQNYSDALTEKTKQFEAIKAEFSEFKDEIRDDIPGLIEMQKSLRAVLTRVRMEVDMSNLWVGGEGAASYNRLSEEQRQKVILAEMAISSLDYFRLQAANKTVAAEIFDGLTDFYAARATALDNNAADLSRAFVYVDRACDIDPKTPIHFSRRGALTLRDYSNSPVARRIGKLDKARADFDCALSLDPNHPSSLYCLAWIMDEKKEFKKSIELLTTMIDKVDSLPRDSRGRRVVNAYINRACARSKLLQSTAVPDGTLPTESFLIELRTVLEDCLSAKTEAQAGAQELRFESDMKREWGLGGDLFGLCEHLTDEQIALVGRLKGL